MIRRMLEAAIIVTLVPCMLGVTIASPGTVVTIVNPNLFTKPSGEEHLHGIVRDPISGAIYVGDWNTFGVGNTPFFGPYIENKDSLRRIDALAEVSIVKYVAAPNALAYNAADRSIYVATGSCGANPRVAGPSLNGIVAIDPAKGTARIFSGGSPQAQFSGPVGIASDPSSGALYVSEGCANRIREVDSHGDAATLAGSGTKGTDDGTGLAASFNDPRGITFCEISHTIYVADTGNNEIRAIDVDGRVETLAGSPQAGYADATGSAARFNHPTGVACDDAGNVYVADSENNVIRKVTPDGVVTTVAGDSRSGTVDGVGIAARFALPGDLTYDPSEHALYVVDWSSNNVRKVTIAATSAQR
jgi:hypothetical protein